MRLRNFIFLILTFLSGSSGLFAQTNFYAEDQVQEIRIYFSQSNWDGLLDSLYVEGLNNRLPCTVEVNGTRFEGAGIRYKGFSSYSLNRVKNPFNIDLNYFRDYQSYQGVDKIKLSNVIQDPSFLREVLSYEIARKYMPASRSNFANVYINDTLWGLYTNVESVEDSFLKENFGSDHLTFIKGNPATVDLNGENSNLSNSPGTDTTAYYPFYDLKSDYGWTHLYELIDTLNNEPEHVQEVLNVDRTLWMHAFNYVLVNFDSYIGYAQNYYLYRDEFGVFQPIVWDLNMSFGSFRFTDASEYFAGFNITEAKVMDPLAHYNTFSVHPRPLMRNLFENDTYRRMYLAHIRTILEENFESGEYMMRGQLLQNLIDAHVAADTNKFYSYADFRANLDTTTSDLIDYPGIFELMEARSVYLRNYPGINGAPTLSPAQPIVADIAVGDDLNLQIEAQNADSVLLAVRFLAFAPFECIPMWDDGTHNDGAAGDGTFGATISISGPVLEYYFYAENDSAGAFSPKRAAHEFYSLNLKTSAGDVVINEVNLANALETDPAGEAEPWVEIFNPSRFAIPLNRMHLTPSSAPQSAWALPDTVLEPGEYLTVWMDGDTNQSGLHSNFSLSPEGGDLSLVYPDDFVVDQVRWGPQSSLTTLGRYPNGKGEFVEMFPSFGRINNFVYGGLLENELFLYPNPATDFLKVKVNREEPFSLWIFAANGQKIYETSWDPASGVLELDTQNFAPGLYIVRAFSDNWTANQKFIISE